MSATVFQIEDGVVGLKVVDTAAVGYSDAWQAPAGAEVDEVLIAAYETGSTVWKCQVTSGMLSSSANDNDVEVPATFCDAARTVPQPGETSYSLDIDFLQDINVSTGLSRFLFEHDTKQAYFLLGVDGVNPPKAIGRVRLVAGAFGGPARANLEASVSLPLTRKPDIEFGDTTTSAVVLGSA